MWLYRVRTRNKGVLISVVTEYGLAGAIRFPTWEDFEEFLVESNAYAEEERARMSKDVPDIFLDAFMEDRERGIRQVAEELKEEIEKLESLGNEKITKELYHLKKLLNIV